MRAYVRTCVHARARVCCARARFLIVRSLHVQECNAMYISLEVTSPAVTPPPACEQGEQYNEVLGQCVRELPPQDFFPHDELTSHLTAL